jgi:hypothetical protein
VDIQATTTSGVTFSSDVSECAFLSLC